MTNKAHSRILLLAHHLSRTDIHIMKFLAYLLVFAFVSTLSHAGDKEFIRSYTYIAGEADSKISARQMAMQEVKRELLSEIGTYIYARIDTSENSKGEVYAKQEIRALTAGIVKLETLEESWNGYQFYIKAKMVSDPDQVVKHINELVHDDRQTESLKLQLVESNTFTQNLQLEMQILNEELSNTRSKQKKLELAISYSQKTLALSINNDYVKGLNFYWGSKDQPPNYLQAAYWFNEAAKQKYSGAQFKLGLIYEKGQGVKPDLTIALDWYKKAAIQGYANAQFKMAKMYLAGINIPKDFKAAIHWLNLAAIQGDSPSQLALADIYFKGVITEQSYLLSARWFLAAAHQGEALAQYQLGLLYRNGLGVEQDYQQAAKWLVKATNQGHTLAKINLQSLQEGGHF